MLNETQQMWDSGAFVNKAGIDQGAIAVIIATLASSGYLSFFA